MMKEKTLVINHSQGQYPILIGRQLIGENIFTRLLNNNQQVMVVTSETVAELYLHKLLQALPEKLTVATMVLPDGEKHKTLATYQLIVEQLAAQQFHRDAMLIALGGGVIGDMAGFAAATYHRGINFIQVPTTLLAQVDASIGGKTAVNLAQGKNLVGAFHQPKAVIIDIDTLATLPERQLTAACAEIIKAALISDSDFFKWLEQNIEKILQRDQAALLHAIEVACHIKKEIVNTDEREQGIRALLNLGHTFGHAIEKLLGYGTYLHGEAVAVGTVLASRLSYQLGWISSDELTKIIGIFTQAGLPTELPSHIKYDRLHTAMLGDKKILDNQLRLVLLKGIGNAVITADVTAEQLKQCLTCG